MKWDQDDMNIYFGLILIVITITASALLITMISKLINDTEPAIKSDMFDKERERTIKSLDNSLAILRSNCIMYPNINTFVNLLLMNEKNPRSFNNITQGQLQMLIYDISKIDFHQLHYTSINCDWVENLNHFIGNYFLDDASFIVTKETMRPHLWVARSVSDYDRGYRDSLILIEAAKDNAKFYFDCEQSQDGPNRRNIWMQGMVSSGNVEKLLA